jgi:hypothetical protein
LATAGRNVEDHDADDRRDGEHDEEREHDDLLGRAAAVATAPP